MTAAPPWMVEVVRFYQPLGFFEEQRELSDAPLAEWIPGRYEEVTEEDFFDDLEYGAFEPRNDVAILLLDEERTLLLDMEATTPPGHGMYEDALGRLARISRGAVAISGVTERIQGGEMVVEMTVNGESRTERFEFKDDWYDPRVFAVFQPLLDPHALRVCAHDDDSASSSLLLTVLTDAERETIERERGVRWR